VVVVEVPSAWPVVFVFTFLTGVLVLFLLLSVVVVVAPLGCVVVLFPLLPDGLVCDDCAEAPNIKNNTPNIKTVFFKFFIPV